MGRPERDGPPPPAGGPDHQAADPERMAWAVRYACEAGRLAHLGGRIPRKLYANASSPTDGLIGGSRG